MSVNEDWTGGNRLGPVIAVPEDLAEELAEVGLAHELPTLRGTVFDVVVTVGMDSAALVTLIQAPDAVRAFAAWLTGRFRSCKDTISITSNRGGRSVSLVVGGYVPVEAVTDFLLAALRGPADQSDAHDSASGS